MSIVTNHNIHTGTIVSSADIASMLSILHGEVIGNPQFAPHLQQESGSAFTAGTYRFKYSYVSWRNTNGQFEIVEETQPSPASVITLSSSANIRIYFQPCPSSYANGISIYQENPSIPGKYCHSILITDPSLSDFLINASNLSFNRQPLTINTFQTNTPSVSFGSQLGLPIPFNLLSDNLVTATITTGTPFVFTGNQDFLLFSVTYKSVSADNTPVEVYTTNSGYRIWVHNEVNSTESSRFGYPVPIPYTETGISISNSQAFIIGAYTGINRAYTGSVQTISVFSSQIQGPFDSPASKFTVPYGGRAIVVYGSPQTSEVGTPTVSYFAVGAGTDAKGANSTNTYTSTNVPLFNIRMSSPSTMFGGGIYGAWNRGSFNPFIQPVILDQLEYITTTTSDIANVFGYIVHD